VNRINLMRLAAAVFVLWAVPALAQVPANQHPIRIGADQSGANVFRGRIAAVRLYDRPLRADEVKALAAASMCGVKVAGENVPVRQRKRYTQADLSGR